MTCSNTRRKDLRLTSLGPHLKTKRQGSVQVSGPDSRGVFGDFFAGLSGMLRGEVTAAMKKSHKSNFTAAELKQADWTLLGQNKTIVLAPDAIEGPYCKEKTILLP